jgi:predicted phage terminase large subunit-like protein
LLLRDELELLRRRKAQESLIAFTEFTFPEFEAGKHHRIIAEALEDVEAGKCKRLMIFAPPRHTKSELASRRFPAWYIGRNPNKQLICTTYAQEFADDFGHDVRGIVRDESYGLVFPTVHLADDSKAKNKWRTNKGGIYIAAGIDGPITGRGAHVAMIDDPFKNRQDAFSQTNREHVWKWYTSVLRTRLMPGGAIILIMTRWHEDDLAGRLLERAKKGGEQWRVISLPAMTEGQPLWPEWFNLGELEAIKSTLPVEEWQALYQQDPTPDDGIYFKREWFRRYTDLPTNLTVYMSGDFAVSEGKGDFTSIFVWGVDHTGRIFVLDYWTDQAGSDRWMWQVITMMKQWKPWAHCAEAGVIKKAIEPFLLDAMNRQNVACVMEWLPTTGDKPAMCQSFKALLSCGRVYFPATDKGDEIIMRLLKFPGGMVDDDADACGVFGRFINRVFDANKPEEPPKPVSWELQPQMQMGELFKMRKRA